MFIVSGAFATDIPSSASTADCKNNPLQTYSGTSNLAVDWAPNEIALHWYNGDTELTVPTASQTCTYDGTLTPPTTIPTKTGYTFKGWRVKQVVQCSFIASELNGMSGVGSGHARLNGSAGVNESQYGLTTPGEWAVEFNTGIIKGMAKCSDTNGGSRGTSGTPSDTDGKYCWCQATNYTPNGGNQCNVASPSWVYYGNGVSPSTCAKNCANYCANRVKDYADFRRVVFPTQEEPECSLSGLDPSIDTSYDATHIRWKQISSTGYTMAEEFGTENSSDLNSGEWALTFSYGTVKGIAKCSNTNGGGYATLGSPSDTDGRYCWCRATNYTPNGGNQCNVSSSSWVFIDIVYGSADDCARGCVYSCASDVLYVPDFRRAVFGVQ